MDMLRQYIMSLVCAFAISSILMNLSSKTCFHKQMKLTCGIFLVIMYLSPIVKWRLPAFSASDWTFSSEAKAASEAGEAARWRSVRDIIMQETQAYILKEAQSLGADIEISLELDDGEPPLPYAVTIRGSFDADSETELSRILVERLSIPKERQTWIRQEFHASGSS